MPQGGVRPQPLDAAGIRARLAAMAALQDRHNAAIHPDWRTRGHAYYRAIWVECAELLEHFGWKWWKRQQPNIEQAKLEIVDIWHFGLSDLLRADAPLDAVADALRRDLSMPAGGGFADAVETLALRTLDARRFDAGAFAAVMRALPLGFDELFRLYVGKNVLNAFRQAHGYGAGTYRKRWNGREDNEHLVEAMAALDADAAAFPEALEAALAARYAAARA